VDTAESKMNRLYAVESTPTNTGAMADHRLRMRASEIENFSRALAKELGLAVAAGPPIPSAVNPEWIRHSRATSSRMQARLWSSQAIISQRSCTRWYIRSIKPSEISTRQFFHAAIEESPIDHGIDWGACR